MDTALVQALFSLTGRSVIVDAIVIIIAEHLPYIVVLGAFIVIFKNRTWRHQLFTLLFTVLSLIVARGIVVELVRFFYHRPRPFAVLDIAPLVDISGWAFPSGHASFFFALAFVMFFFSPPKADAPREHAFSGYKRWGWWFLAFAILNGIARIVVGVHWATDIIGGVAVGFIGFGVVYLLLKDTWKQLQE